MMVKGASHKISMVLKVSFKLYYQEEKIINFEKIYLHKFTAEESIPVAFQMLPFLVSWERPLNEEYLRPASRVEALAMTVLRSLCSVDRK